MKNLEQGLAYNEYYIKLLLSTCRMGCSRGVELVERA